MKKNINVMMNGKTFNVGNITIGSDFVFIDSLDLKMAKKLPETKDLSGKGLGKKAYNKIESIAKQEGKKEIIGEIEPTMKDSIGFWEKMGFKFITKETVQWRKLKEKLLIYQILLN